MKKMYTTAAIALVLGAGMLLSSAAHASDTEAVALEALIVEPIAITVDNGIDFGSIGAGATGGTVVLPAASDTRTTTGDAFFGGTPQRGQFDVTCDDTQNIQASFGTPTGLTVGSVGTFTLDPNLLTSTLCADQANVRIGATYTLPATPTAGAQTGSVDLTVSYP